MPPKMKFFEKKKLVIASNNKGKIKEISLLLSPFEIEVVAAGEFPFTEPEETGDTFIENAEIKSRYYATHTGVLSLSDDSGLEVEALDGAPGVISANWAEKVPGGERDFNFAMQRVENELIAAGIKTRGNLSVAEKAKLKANFTCVLSLCDDMGKTINFTGKVFGTLQFPPKGDKGFGYDAIFVADGMDKTFAEIDREEKYKISHRSDAFAKLKKYFEQD